MTDIKDSVDDYLERNQDAFDEFATPDEAYYEVIEQLDSLEARAAQLSCCTDCCMAAEGSPHGLHVPAMGIAAWG
jgi:hypothetical protein